MYVVFKEIIGTLLLMSCALSSGNTLLSELARTIPPRKGYFGDSIKFENERESYQHLCQLRGPGSGMCIEIPNCPQLSVLLNDPTPSNLKILQQALCGYANRSPRVCCISPEEIAIFSPVAPVHSSSSLLRPPPSPLPSQEQPVPPPPSLAPALSEQCGVTKLISTRIIGGKEAEPGAWPWLAAVVYRLPDGAQTFGCAGSLISSRHVLTAAHCIPDIQDVVLQAVRLGAHNLPHLGFTGGRFPENRTQFVEIAVERAIPHPQYVKKQLSKNDLAILKLSREAVFSDYIQPICIPVEATYRNRDLIGQTAYVAGWGATSFRDKIPSPVLKQASFPIVDASTCKSAYDKVRTSVVIDETVLCAGDGTGKSDSCQGDSGGPLMHEVNGAYYVAGVVSSGHKCAEPGFYGVYMRTAHYAKWILENIK